MNTFDKRYQDRLDFAELSEIADRATAHDLLACKLIGGQERLDAIARRARYESLVARRAAEENGKQV